MLTQKTGSPPLSLLKFTFCHTQMVFESKEAAEEATKRALEEGSGCSGE